MSVLDSFLVYTGLTPFVHELQNSFVNLTLDHQRLPLLHRILEERSNGHMEIWRWASSCCARRRPQSLPGVLGINQCGRALRGGAWGPCGVCSSLRIVQD